MPHAVVSFAAATSEVELPTQYVPTTADSVCRDSGCVVSEPRGDAEPIESDSLVFLLLACPVPNALVAGYCKPKTSRRSKRIWIAFIVANGLFYVTVLGLSVLHEAKVMEAQDTPTHLVSSNF